MTGSLWARLGMRTRLTLSATLLVLSGGLVVVGLTYTVAARDLVRPVPLPTAVQPTPGPDDQVVPFPAGPTPRTISLDQSTRETLERSIEEVRADSLRALLIQSSAALGLMTVLAGVSAWWITGRVLTRLTDVTKTAKALSERDLHLRLSLAPPDDEIKELGDTFDEMLDRLESAFTAQERFVANASHELRTPLTIQRTVLELARQRPEVTDWDALTTCLLGVTERSERTTEALLMLARVAADHRDWRTFDLLQCATAVSDEYQDVADARHVTMHVEGVPVAIQGDQTLVERLVANVIDNALKYNHRGGTMSLRVSATTRHASVSIENSGPRVRQADVETLTEPFTRLPTPDCAEKGSGLGLSIVQAIALQHRAALHLEVRPAGGLLVQVSFPRLEPPDEQVGEDGMLAARPS